MKETDILISKFEKAVLEYDKLRECGTAKQMNLQFDLMHEIVSELIKFTEAKELLYNDNELVKFWGASMLLPLFPDESIKILEEISKTKGFYAFNAKITLQEWRKGNIKFEYYQK